MKNYLSLIKFSHTIFALPFALLGYFMGVKDKGEGIEWSILVLVLLCMVFARSAAMAFNRYLDRDIDRQNPRTAQREIPAGIIGANEALIFVIANSLFFIATTFFINPLCFFLSPLALLIILGYSFTKRFTFLCHFVLGLGLALAPVGAYLAVVGSFALIPVLYGLAVMTWVSGFDIIYALQDTDFDRSMGLKSIPESIGPARALQLSTLLHLCCGVLMVWAGALMAGLYTDLQWLHWVGTGIFLFLLSYQHLLVKPEDLSRVNLAFFTTNGVASLIFGTLVVLDFFL